MLSRVGLIPEMDDDVMDEQSALPVASTSLILRRMGQLHDAAISGSCVQTPSNELIAQSSRRPTP